MKTKTIINKIISSLKDSNIRRIILFGSYAYGNPGPDSDIDLLVVTDDHFIPGSFKEKIDLKIKISKKLDKVREDFPVDLIVHTAPMHKRFLEIDSTFKREILSRGLIIYERNN